jgi:hypothetical protein
MIFAAYFLFADPKLSEAMAAILLNAKHRIREQFSAFNLFNIGVVLLCAIVALGLMAVLNQKVDTPRSVHLVLWGCYCFVVMATFLLALLAFRKQPAQVSFSVAHWSLLLLPILVFVNGTSPYLGLKTEFSFAMFSNLRDRPWRHVLVPDRLRPFRMRRYLRLAGVRGLPPPRELDADGALIVDLLSQFERYCYPPYFLRAIERAQLALKLTLEIFLDVGGQAPLGEVQRQQRHARNHDHDRDEQLRAKARDSPNLRL